MIDPPIQHLLYNPVGADLLVRAKLSDTTFPAGTSARMVLYELDGTTLHTTITGTANGTDAFEFRMESTVSDQLSDRMIYRLYVTILDTPNIDFLWWFGSLQRTGVGA